MPGTAPLRFLQTQMGGADPKIVSSQRKRERGNVGGEGGGAASLMKSARVAADQPQLKQPCTVSQGQ